MQRVRRRWARTWSWRGLRMRTTAVVLLVTTVASVVAYVLLVWLADRQFDAAVDEGLHTRVQAVAESLRLGDPVVDPFAEVVDAGGRVVVAGSAMSGVVLLDRRQVASALRAPTTSQRSVTELGGDVRVLTEPFDGSVIVVVSRTADLDAAVERLRLLLAVALAVLVVVAATGAWALVGRTLRPVGAMTATAARIGTGTATATGAERLPDPHTRDEIADLADTLNEMLERLVAALRRERAFVDDASHELRTPLTLLRGELELALAEEDPAEVREGTRRALGAAERLSALAADLLVLARESAGTEHTRQTLELSRWLDDVASHTATLPITVEVRTLGGLQVEADASSLERAVTNLLVNAQSAGATRALLSAQPGDDERHVDLCVDDDGPGFPPDFVGHALDRFSRGDAARSGGGAGLGLAIVDAVVRAHGGTVHLDGSSPLGGARVRLRLPSPGTGPPSS